MTEWIIGFIESGGYVAIAALMMLENVFPPIPSELVLPFAGYVAATGKLNPIGVLVAAVIGALLGALPWYWAGRKLGHGGLKAFASRHGRLLTMSPDDVDRAQEWFRRHGPASVAFGRLVPAVRSVISMPAGVARLPVWKFLLWSLIGTTVWSALLLSAGWILKGSYEQAQQTIEWVTRAVVAAMVLWYLWRVATFGRRHGKRGEHGHP